MFTIFTIPKPFTDKRTAIIQTNAIKSWKRLTPNIFLIGDDPGVKLAAKKLEVTHFSDIKRNTLGTPYLQPAFDLATRNSPDDYLCYVNADIIFFDDFLNLFRYPLPKPGFLIVGQRWDIDVDFLINFRNKNWQQMLKNEIKIKGSRHAPAGSDYFVFRREHLFDLPNFVVGRPAWDNWMIYEARKLKIPVIDVGNFITALHQNHSYVFYKGPGIDVWSGPEAERHFEIIGSKNRRFDLWDADWVLTDGKLVKRIFPIGKWWQYLSFTPEVLPGSEKTWGLANKLLRFLYPFYFAAKEIFSEAKERAMVLSK